MAKTEQEEARGVSSGSRARRPLTLAEIILNRLGIKGVSEGPDDEVDDVVVLRRYERKENG